MSGIVKAEIADRRRRVIVARGEIRRLEFEVARLEVRIKKLRGFSRKQTQEQIDHWRKVIERCENTIGELLGTNNELQRRV